jgi:hypothetical protein
MPLPQLEESLALQGDWYKVLLQRSKFPVMVIITFNRTGVTFSKVPCQRRPRYRSARQQNCHICRFKIGFNKPGLEIGTKPQKRGEF